LTKRDKSGLTKLELQVMQVIWKRGASMVSDVQEGLEQALAYTTVQRDLVDRMFGGSSEDLVMSLIKSKQIDAKKLAELSKRVEEGEDA
jgi:predicted transcriptional regulator